jgi:hypothetical protein
MHYWQAKAALPPRKRDKKEEKEEREKQDREPRREES